MNFEKDLAIDKSRLDEELMRQAQMMMQYSRAHAQAQYDRDRAKQARDVVEATLDTKARTEHAALGIPSSSKTGGPTEATISNWIKLQPEWQKAQAERMRAEHEVNLLLGAVMAFNARKAMLESLVRLLLSEWYAEPRVKGGEDMKARAAQAAMEEAVVRGFAPDYDWGDPPEERRAKAEDRPPSTPAKRRA